MKIIDAHLHYSQAIPEFAEQAREVGHRYTEAHLRAEFARLNIDCGIVMGNGGLSLEEHTYPDCFRYCIGLDSNSGDLEAISPDAVEAHLKRPQCVGIKLYPGYCHAYVSDPRYVPLYELARQYDKPVAIHTGSTAGGMGRLKYSHPLTVDDAASEFPDVRFVLCHFGNPWLTDAAAVMEKNENVFADLSGLLEGHVNPDTLFEANADYLNHVRMWMGYAGGWEKIMYGTDFP
ncbi:MAG: amidohydrolase family protein, partial [Butyricicoccaceae bacterium]